jgi:hypothetical protein
MERMILCVPKYVNDTTALGHKEDKHRLAFFVAAE